MRRRMDDVLTAQFAECADMILSGASIADCLERFSENRAQLEPMLNSIVGLRQARPTPVRSPEVALASRTAYMSAAFQVQRDRRAAEAAGPWWQKVFTIFQPPPHGAPRTRPVALFAILLILFISGIVISGSVTLAANALPGDPLYHAKTATENVRLFLAPDEEMRTQLRTEFGQRRIDEAQAVVETRRPVDNLRLQGTIESFDAQQWRVSGLRVVLDASSQIEGTPGLGAKVVDGRVRAPGDGRLLLIYAVLEPPPAPQVKSQTVEPTATATLTPKPTATPTVTAEPPVSPVPTLEEPQVRLVLPGLTPFEPTDAPSLTPTSPPTATPTATRTPSRTPTATRTRTPVVTPTATWTLPPPRPTPASVRIIGRIVAMNGNIWTIGSTQVEVAPETQIIGYAVVGAKVECEAWLREGLPPLAYRITVTAGAEATPEPVEFQDFILAINRPWWTIGGFRLKETEDTQVSPGLKVGDRVSVRALRQSNDELWATSIGLVPANEVQVDGTIEAYSGSSITIDGVTMAIDSATQFVGTPAVGRPAQARALQYSDGSLVARVVVVLEMPTDTPTPEPTATPTPEPMATPILEPSATPTVSPDNTTTPIETAIS